MKRLLTRFLPILTSAILVLAFGDPAAASAPVVLASPGPSPFLGCTADNAAAQIAAGSVLVPELGDRAAVDDQPHERDEHRRRVPAGPLERRRRARPRRERQPRRRGRPGLGSWSRRSPSARAAPTTARPTRGSPSRRTATCMRSRSALAPSLRTTPSSCPSRPTAVTLGRSDRGDRRRHQWARQGVDHRRPARLEPRVRDLGPAAHSGRQHARLGPGRHPFAVLQVADLLRSLDRRRDRPGSGRDSCSSIPRSRARSGA